LRYVLENGDTCEIITQKNQRPKKDWLEFVKTSKARNKIRGIMRSLERERSRDIGRELLDKEFRKYGSSLQREIKNESIEYAIKERHLASLDEALALIGYGKLDPRQIVDLCLPEEEKQIPLVESKISRITQLFDRLSKRKQYGGIQV